MSISNPAKARLIQKALAALKKRYEPPPRREPVTLLEQLILAVLSDGTTTAKTDQVFQRLKANYFDWNEVRVSAVAELQEVLAELPEPEQRAARLKNCLKFIFETTYSFDLDAWRKVPMKEVTRRLARMPGSSPYTMARLVRDGLGGKAVPLDSAAVRILTRLELIDAKVTAGMLGASLSRSIPQVRSFEFCHLFSELGADVCTETEPRCKKCCLLEMCPTGPRRIQELQAAAANAAKRNRGKAKSRRSKAR